MNHSKWLSMAMMFAASLALTAPAALADDTMSMPRMSTPCPTMMKSALPSTTGTSVQEITVGKTSSNLPSWDAHGNQVVLFHVINPTASTVTFSVPNLGIRNAVPAGADRTFYVDMTKLSGASVNYAILNTRNDKLHSGMIQNTADATMQSQATVVEELVVGRSESSVPAWDAHGNRVVLFHVVNPTASAVKFEVPDLGIRDSVPAGDDRTFHVDMSRVGGTPITYNVLDSNNANVITGMIHNTAP